MFEEDEIDNPLVDAGRRLVGELGCPSMEVLVVALTPGGAQVGVGVAGHPVPIVEGFTDVAELGEGGERPIVLVDDGELPPETLGAAAWALRSVARRLFVAAPIASRYLEEVLPPGTQVYVERRYTPVRDRPWTPRRPQRPLRQRPARAGRPWEPEEDARLDALVSQGKPAREIAEVLGRTRGAVESRIARNVILRGAARSAVGQERPPWEATDA